MDSRVRMVSGKMFLKFVRMFCLLHFLYFFSEDERVKQFQCHSLMPEIRYGYALIME